MLVATGVVVQKSRRAIPDPLDDVGQAEDCLLARKAVRQVFQDFCQRPKLSVRLRSIWPDTSDRSSMSIRTLVER